MIANFDEFNRLEKPSLILTNPEEIPIKPIDDSYIKNYVFNPKFNDISEITFDIYEHNGNDGNIFEGYKKIIQRMRISVSGYGSWIISQATEHKSNNGESNYKQVVLKSTEYELQDIQIPYIDGTYKFYDIVNFSNSLMGIVLSKIPRWTISHVDSTISSLYRTFEVPDTNVLSFLLNDVQEAYGCIFIFDGVNRTISVYDKDTYVHYTGVVLTNDELIDTIEISRSDENLVTALSVYGSDDLGINAVNPLGTSTIYNFYQVKSWMSDALKAKVDSWENEVNAAETTVKDLNISISSLNKELTSIETSITSAEQTLTGLKAERDVIISEGNQSSLTSINAEITTAENNLSTLKVNYDSKNNEITSKKNQLSSIQTSLSPSVYFGDLYNNFLSYVYEFEYTNDNIAVTDSMTYEERINEIQTLYDTAKDVLEQKVNIPNTYSVDAKSFVFNKKFLKHTHALQCGYLIGVETEGNNDGNIEYFPITEFEVNYEDNSLKLTFGNKFNSAKAKDLFEDLMHDVRTTGRIVDYINSKKADSDQISDMQKFINSSLDLSKNAILSADGQTVEITDSGYHGRKINADGSLDKEELSIINNIIAFSRDNWATCSLALGKLRINNSYVYGIIAEAIIGTLIMGENLYISNTSGTYTIDDSGLVATHGNTTVTINPSSKDSLFVISNNGTKQFYVDSDGNVKFAGTLEGANGTFDGSVSANAIISPDARYGSTGKSLGTAIDDNISAQIQISKNSITSTVAKYSDIYDETGYTISYYGYEDDPSSYFKPSNCNGSYYLNVSNGKLFKSNGTSWVYQNVVLKKKTDVIGTLAEQTDNKFSWLVNGGDSASNFTLTDRTAELVAKYINLNGLVTFSGLNQEIKQEITTGETVYYLLSNSNTGITTSTSGWQTTPLTTTSSQRYLWQYYSYTFADGSTAKSTPIVVGVYGDTGSKGDKGDIGVSVAQVTPLYYQSNSTSYPSKPTSEVTSTSDVALSWTKIQPSFRSGYEYFYICSQVKFSNGTFGCSEVTLDRGLSNMGKWCHESDTTLIDGGKIYTGSITADKIKVNDLSALNATIGSWNIESKQIVNETTVNDKRYQALMRAVDWSGETNLNERAFCVQTYSESENWKQPFWVDYTGKLHAENAEISGYTTTSDFSAATARIGTIEANYVSTSTLTTNYATIDSLNAVNAKFSSLSADNITTGTLNFNRLQSYNGASAEWVHYTFVYDVDFDAKTVKRMQMHYLGVIPTVVS